MEDKWLNEWQKKLDGYEVAPPDGLWDGINKALEERRLSVCLLYTSPSPRDTR